MKKIRKGCKIALNFIGTIFVGLINCFGFWALFTLVFGKDMASGETVLVSVWKRIVQNEGMLTALVALFILVFLSYITGKDVMKAWGKKE